MAVVFCFTNKLLHLFKYFYPSDYVEKEEIRMDQTAENFLRYEFVVKEGIGMNFENNEEAGPSGIVMEKGIETDEETENYVFFPCEFVVKEDIEMNFENNEETGPSGIVMEKEIETDEAAERLYPLEIVVKEEIETDEVEDSNLTDNEYLAENDEKFYQCGACMDTFAEYDDLKEHVKEVRIKKNTSHPPILTSFNCFKCKKSFAKMGTLKAHVVIHTGEKTHECPAPECSKRFLRFSGLKRHVTTIHLDEKPFRCEVCEKPFARKAHCILHMRTHTGEKPHECHICHRYFSHPYSLKQHVLTHADGMNFKCEVCPGEKLFKTKQSLVHHMYIHNKEKFHKCFKCDMKFVTTSNRTRHERIHLGIKPFECEYCQKSFTHKCNLARHIRTHTGEKPYKCELCGRGFRQLGNAKIHIRKEKSKAIEERCDYKKRKEDRLANARPAWQGLTKDLQRKRGPHL